MPAVQLTTYRDALDYAYDFLGDDRSVRAARDARKAILQAYRRLAQETKWTLYYHRGRFLTNEPYSTGTIAFDLTGGATCERQLTLSSGTWPSWTHLGSVVISNRAYEVAERVSDTVVQLTSANNPGEDVASGTSYSLVRDTYPLPIDFQACDRMLNMTRSFECYYTHPREFVNRQQIYHGPSDPHLFTVTGEPNYQGVLALRLYPPPDDTYQFEYLYHRSPRQIVVDEYKTGTVTGSADSATITGTGTAWTSNHVGCSLRFGTTTEEPTGVFGANLAIEERVVMSVESATSLTVDSALDNSHAAVKYVLSDPIDVDRVMLNAFWAGVCWELAKTRRMEGQAMEMARYMSELKLAMAADSRSMGRRAAGEGPAYLRRLADMPVGDDEP